MPTRKTLRAIAHNIAHSFLSVGGAHYLEDSWPVQHLLLAARAGRVEEVNIDLLTGQVHPASIASDIVRKAADNARLHFIEMVRASNSSVDFVTAASLRLVFRFDEKVPGTPAGHIFGAGVLVPEMVPYSADVTVVDDRGKRHSASVPEWWRT